VAIWGNGDIHYQGASRLNLFDPHIRPAPDQEEAEVLYVRLETLMQGLGTWEHIARLRVDQLTELARMEDDPSAREPWLARAELIAANSLFEPQRVAARATIASRRGQWHEALALLRHGAEQFPMEVDWIAAAERAAPLPDDPSEAHQVLETTESDARGLVAVALARGAAVASDYPSSLRWIMEAVQSSLPHDRTQAIAGQILSEATAYSEDTGNFLESRTICGVADPLIQILPRSPGVQILLSRMRAAARLWPSSLRAIEEGERLFPDEADWLTLSIFATRGFGPGEIKEDLLDPLITEELGLASVALALRCSELEEHRQALQWMRRAQIEGRSPEENWAQEIWPMANHVFTQAATFARSSDLETRAALLPLLEQHASDYPDDRAAQHTVAEIRRLTASP